MDEVEEIKKKKMEQLLKKSNYGEMKTEIEVDDNNFNELVVEQSKKIPVVVDFWATWCMPCLMLSPALEKAAKEYKGKFILAKLNVDEARITSQKYGIMSIPSVKMFKGGKVADEFIGAVPESVVRNWLDKNHKKIG
ncbi:MAG: thioredoxin [Candidatus Aenigmarchaeota archaeon ex4484_14]|nr:MAG: thioredoxin [Candidatus Aenigmarchaeota archaeon ex4484_14]